MSILFLKNPAPICLAGNPAILRVAGSQAYDNNALRDFYRIGIKPEEGGEVIVSALRHVSPKTDADITPGFEDANTGVMQIDIQDILSDERIKHFTFPEPDEGLHFLHNIMREIKVLAYERFGNPPAEQQGIYSPVFRVLQGRISTLKQGELNYLGKSFYNLLVEQRMFLTFAPKEKVTDIYTPERLYFIFTTAGTLKLKVKFYYTDGLTETFDRDTVIAEQNSLYEFLTSYAKLKGTITKRVVKYDVWLTNDGDEAISEIRTFRIDYNYYESARWFLFLNRLGVYEIVRTTGIAEEGDEIKKSNIRIPLDDFHDDLAREEKQISQTRDIYFTINSGYFNSKEEAEWFSEFRESSDAYQLIKGKAYPVIIQDSKSVLNKDREYNFSSEITLKPAIGQFVSNKINENIPIILGDFSLDFSNDFFIGSQVPEPPPPVTFYNIAMSSNFTRSNCGAGSHGSVVPYVVPAGKYTSTISQADANQKALNDIAINGQAYANANGTCSIDPPTYYYNIRMSVTLRKNNCGGVSEGSEVPYVVEAGTYTSTISQDDANAKAQADIDANAQNYANSQGFCTWYNQQRTASATKSDCAINAYGSTENLVVPEGEYSSLISQADANAQADAYLAANVQANANQTGDCTLRDEIPVQVYNNGYACQIVFDPGNPAYKVIVYEGTQTAKLLDGLSYTITANGNFHNAGIGFAGPFSPGQTKSGQIAFPDPANGKVNIYLN